MVDMDLERERGRWMSLCLRLEAKMVLTCLVCHLFCEAIGLLTGSVWRFFCDLTVATCDDCFIVCMC